MWSFVGNKKNPRWLWHGIDRSTGLFWRMFSADEKMSFSQAERVVRAIWY
jgi:IS1 family transposase